MGVGHAKFRGKLNEVEERGREKIHQADFAANLVAQFFFSLLFCISCEKRTFAWEKAYSIMQRGKTE